MAVVGMCIEKYAYIQWRREGEAMEGMRPGLHCARHFEGRKKSETDL